MRAFSFGPLQRVLMAGNTSGGSTLTEMTGRLGRFTKSVICVAKELENYSIHPPDNLFGVAWLWNHNASEQLPKPDQSVLKCQKVWHQGHLEINAPKLAADYNEHMGAVDHVDRVS